MKADLERLSSSGQSTLRSLISGLLSQGFQAILVYRFFNWLLRKGVPGQPFRFFFERFIEIICGISIPARCQIGQGFRIHHFGGIIFHPSTIIGAYCTCYHGVTIGDRGGLGGAAKIGDNVVIGAGAKIIGEVLIGNNVIIGANAVINKNVPADTVAVGNPARYLPNKRTHVTAYEVLSNTSAPVRVMDFRGTYKGGGGPDKTVLNSAALHDKNKVDVRVVYIRDPRDLEFQIGDRARAMGLNYSEFEDSKFFDWRCIRQLVRFVKQEKIEVIHSHDDKTSLYGFIIKLFVPSAVIVFTVHLHTPLDPSEYSSKISYIKSWFRRRVVIWLIKRYKRPIMAVSDHTRKTLADDGLPYEDTVNFCNCIDIGLWKKSAGVPVLRDELNIDDKTVIVGTVARIAQKHKDFPTFYKVAKALSEKYDHVKFIIVGDGHGGLLEEARQEVRQMGLEHVLFFTGHRNDLLDIYRSMDIFLMTSTTEGMPNTVLEAMAMEVPVVSTSVAGVPELIADGESGILCPIKDVDKLVVAVSKLIENKELRTRYSEAGRNRIEKHFDFSKRVKKLEDYYISCAKRLSVSE
jgi:glycosyltransferase involved in cell wall biosynthesis